MLTANSSDKNLNFSLCQFQTVRMTLGGNGDNAIETSLVLVRITVLNVFKEIRYYGRVIRNTVRLVCQRSCK